MIPWSAVVTMIIMAALIMGRCSVGVGAVVVNMGSNG